uniref:CSON015111 protein n=1 Tax=Culicoides sonorensis TaxID=179676 RepID=A0A336LT48_CULSO
MIIFEVIFISGIYRNLLKIMLRERRRNVNFKPNRRMYVSSTSTDIIKGNSQRLTGRQKLALANKKGTIDRLGEVLPQCRTFVRLCKHILNLEERHVIKGVWRQRRYLSRHGSSEELRELDAKSSRSVMYENEELRLRTININAEIERGDY